MLLRFMILIYGALVKTSPFLQHIFYAKMNLIRFLNKQLRFADQMEFYTAQFK